MPPAALHLQNGNVGRWLQTTDIPKDGNLKNKHKALIDKSREKRKLGKFILKWEENIKWVFRYTHYENDDETEQFQKTVKLWTSAIMITQS